MTRTAPARRKKHEDATLWDQLKPVTADARSEDGTKDVVKKDVGKTSNKNEVKREKDREARRTRRKVCYKCRKRGHSLAQCPLRNENGQTGICFKCGSTEHAVKNCEAKIAEDTFPFAKCFICGQEGHISRKCPDNPKGLYPFGGGCKFCQSVEHFKKDCQENPSNRKETSRSRGASKRKRNDISSADAETFTDEENEHTEEKKWIRKPKIVKF